MSDAATTDVRKSSTKHPFAARYGNFIGGRFVDPVEGRWFDGGYKPSGIGRENHKMMLDHYQQTKNLLVSYSANRLGFF
jgi:acyl-CoA reductase-like NAD-dependent aldehyde dehydrogenase